MVKITRKLKSLRGQGNTWLLIHKRSKDKSNFLDYNFYSLNLNIEHCDHTICWETNEKNKNILVSLFAHGIIILFLWIDKTFHFFCLGGTYTIIARMGNWGFQREQRYPETRSTSIFFKYRIPVNFFKRKGESLFEFKGQLGRSRWPWCLSCFKDRTCRCRVILHTFTDSI